MNEKEQMDDKELFITQLLNGVFFSLQKKYLNYDLDNPEITEQDPAKMEILYNTCVQVCLDHGVSVELKDRKDDKRLEEVDGYFKPITSQIGEHCGYIVICKELDNTKRVVTLFHEIGHADLYYNFYGFVGASKPKGHDLDRDGLDPDKQFAESVAYALGLEFKIPNEEKAFKYISSYMKSTSELLEISDDVYEGKKNLIAELKIKLDELGYSDALLKTQKPMQDATVYIATKRIFPPCFGIRRILFITTFS